MGPLGVCSNVCSGPKHVVLLLSEHQLVRGQIFIWTGSRPCVPGFAAAAVRLEALLWQEPSMFRCFFFLNLSFNFTFERSAGLFSGATTVSKVSQSRAPQWLPQHDNLLNVQRRHSGWCQWTRPERQQNCAHKENSSSTGECERGVDQLDALLTGGRLGAPNKRRHCKLSDGLFVQEVQCTVELHDHAVCSSAAHAACSEKDSRFWC